MPYQLFMCLFIIKFMFMNNSFFNNPYHKCLTWCQDCSSCVILLPEPPAIQTRPKKGRNLWGPTNIHIFWHDSWVIKVWGKYKRWFSATSRLFYGQEMISWNLHTWIKSSWPAIAEVTTANFFQLYLMMIILKDDNDQSITWTWWRSWPRPDAPSLVQVGLWGSTRETKMVNLVVMIVVRPAWW